MVYQRLLEGGGMGGVTMLFSRNHDRGMGFIFDKAM